MTRKKDGAKQRLGYTVEDMWPTRIRQHGKKYGKQWRGRVWDPLFKHYVSMSFESEKEALSWCCMVHQKFKESTQLGGICPECFGRGHLLITSVGGGESLSWRGP